MYKNLEAEMVRSDITSETIANTIGRSYNTVRARLNGKIPFTLDEAMLIKKKLFPDCPMDYLFDVEA